MHSMDSLMFVAGAYVVRIKDNNISAASSGILSITASCVYTILD